MSAVAQRKKTTYACGKCGRRLKQNRWIYSRTTGARYCWPGTGCNR